MSMPSLTIGRFTVRVPVIQGGMGVRVSLAGLAASVAEAGGIGVISAAGIGLLEPDVKKNFVEANSRALGKEIRLAKSKSSGVIGVNIMGVLTNYEQLVDVSLTEGVDIIFSGAGLPLDLPGQLLAARERDKADYTTALVPIISSARAATVIAKKWMLKYGYTPDAFVVEGPMAGGHLGFKPEQLTDADYSLEKVLAETLEGLKPFAERAGKPIPVIGAGGIYSGEDIHRMFSLGAAGVQMGTRFVATRECEADAAFKQSYLDSTEEDIVIINSPVGLPGRALKNAFIERFQERKNAFGCIFHCMKTCTPAKSPYCIADALFSAVQGKLEKGFAFCGANVARIKELMSVEELVRLLKTEFEQCAPVVSS